MHAQMLYNLSLFSGLLSFVICNVLFLVYFVANFDSIAVVIFIVLCYNKSGLLQKV